jgi:hypothetical protein
MSLVGHMELQLVQAVGVVVASVAPELNRIGHGQELELPLVLRSTLLDVVDMVQTLKVFVRLAVELEVGLQVGLVAAQLADVVGADDDRHLVPTL